MKKVVFLTPSLTVGGMERVLVNYANLFVQYGYDVTVLNFTNDAESIIKNFDKKIHYFPHYEPVKHLFRTKGKDVFRGNFRVLPWSKWISFHSSKYLYKKYIKNPHDVVISFFGVEAAKIINGAPKSVKCLTWIHNTNVEGLIGKIGGKKQTAKVFQDAQQIICVSQEAKENIIECFSLNNNVCVVNNPNNTKRIRALSLEEDIPEKKGFTFVSVSRLVDKAKGYIRLLGVCRKLLDEGRQFYLWIVGDGSDADKIKQKATELKLDNHVSFLGEQVNPYKYMRQADMFICSSYYEGFSMSMMEAVILAKPILTTEVSGAAEMLDEGNAGLIVENSEKGLYEGIQKILADPTLYKYYQQQIERRKDYLTEESIMAQIQNILGE